MRLDGALQPLAQPHQQCVARRVAESVVVELEAVEVIQHQLPRFLRSGGLARDAQIAHQRRRLPRPVSGSVSDRLPRVGEQREVLAQREDQMQPLRPALWRPRGSAPAGSAAGRGCRTRALRARRAARALGTAIICQLFIRRRCRRAGWHPCGDRQQDRGGRPQAFEPGARADRSRWRSGRGRWSRPRTDEHPRGDQQPHAAGSPAGDGDRAEREHHQQQVADRIGERHHERAEIAGGVSRIGGRISAAPTLSRPEPGDQPVEPHARPADLAGGLWQAARARRRSKGTSRGRTRRPSDTLPPASRSVPSMNSE